MPQPPITVAVSDDDSGVRLHVEGELDMATARVLRDETAKVERAHPDVLTFDLAGVPFMDLSGLRVLLEATHRAEKQGRHVRLVNPTPPIVRLMRLTSFDQALDVVLDDHPPNPKPRTGNGHRPRLRRHVGSRS